MSKMARAIEIYNLNNGDKDSVVSVIMEKLSVSKANAQTYFYNVKRRNLTSIKETKVEVKSPVVVMKRPKRVSEGNTNFDLNTLYDSLNGKEKANWSKSIEEAAKWAMENLK